MSDISINDIFRGALLQSINFNTQLNTINISVTSSDAKTEFIKLLSATLNNVSTYAPDPIININILFTFRDYIYYATVNNTNFTLISNKSISSFMQNGGGSIN